MAYSPINNVPQYHVDGVPASGYVLKAYQAGTSTLLQMATAADGLTLVNTITLNSQGYPTVSGNIVIPHLNAAYKMALYPSQAAADANSGPIWIPDHNTPSSIVANISISGNTISSTNTNGDITVDPNGSGQINLNGPTVATTLTAQTVNGTTVDATTLEINNVAVTSSAAELNILDGVTATATELNITDASAQVVTNHSSSIRSWLQSDGTAASAFDVDANITEITFESLGPTGSSATNIYTDMDQIPSGAKSVIFLCSMFGTSSSTSAPLALTLYGRPTGSALALGNGTEICSVAGESANTGDQFDLHLLIEVPCDSSRRCDITWAAVSDTTRSFALYYRGYKV